jgi:hypothetical protein
MAVAGLVRLRRHLFGRQAAHGTKIAAARAYPFSGVPDHDLSWTDPEVDTGSRITVVAPHRERPELTAPLDIPSLRYQDLPLLFSAFLGGGVTPTGGTAKTWAFELDATAIGQPDRYTYEFGDDVLTDWFQYGDSILESFEITAPDDGKGPLTGSTSWRMGSIASTGSTDSPVTGSVPTGGAGGLMPSTTDKVVYLKDGAIYVASSFYDLDGAQITDALHTFTLRLSQEIDLKGFANGEQTWDIDDYAGGAVTIEVLARYAKTSDTVGVGSESDAWMSDNAVNRYIRMVFTSTDDAEYGTPYSWSFTMPARYYTREETEIGGNTVVDLTARAFLDDVEFDGAFSTEIVNTLASL